MGTRPAARSVARPGSVAPSCRSGASGAATVGSGEWNFDVMHGIAGMTPNTPISETQFVVGISLVAVAWLVKIYLWRRKRDRS